MRAIFVFLTVFLLACEPMPVEKAPKNKNHALSQFHNSIEKSNKASEKIGKHNRQMESAMGMADDH